MKAGAGTPGSGSRAGPPPRTDLGGLRGSAAFEGRAFPHRPPCAPARGPIRQGPRPPPRMVSSASASSICSRPTLPTRRSRTWFSTNGAWRRSSGRSRVLRVTAEKRGRSTTTPFSRSTGPARPRISRATSAPTEELLEAALEARRKLLPPNDPASPRPSSALASVARNKWDRVRARACYDEAAKILAGAGPRWEPLRASLDQAEASWLRAVDTDAAIARYQRALERRRRCLLVPVLPDRRQPDLAGPCGERHPRQRRPWLARRSAAELRALGLEASTLNGAVIEGHLASDKGGWVELESHLRAAATIFANARPLQLRDMLAEAVHLDGYEALATAALHQGRFEEALAARRARARHPCRLRCSGALGRRGARHLSARVRALRKDLLEARAVSIASGHASVRPWCATTWRLLLKTLELRAAIDRKEADYLRFHRPAEPSLTDVRKLLDSRSRARRLARQRARATATPEAYVVRTIGARRLEASRAPSARPGGDGQSVGR